MKPIKLMTAVASLLMLCACSQETVLTPDEARQVDPKSNEIAFGTYMGTAKGTRAGYGGPISTTELQDGKDGSKTQGFGVFSYLHSDTWSSHSSIAPNFMYNQQVYYDADSWKYSPIKYWPNGIDKGNTNGSPSDTAEESSTQYLSFFAYAPYVEVTANTGAVSSGTDSYGITALSKNTDTGNPIISYKLAPKTTNSTDYVDLLWAVRPKGTYKDADGIDNTTTEVSYNTDLTKQTTEETVDFLFKHALAKIGGSEDAIQVVYDIDGNSGTPESTGFGADDDNTLVTITSVKISTTSSNSISTSGKFDIANGKWTDVTNETSETEKISVTSTTNMNTEIAEPSSAPTHETNWGISGVKSTPKNLFKSDLTTFPGFYLIPGQEATNAVDQVFKVTVSYTVRTYDANLANSASNEGTWTKVTQTITNNVTFKKELLEPNKFYKLIIHIGLTSVKFSATVDNWDSSSSATPAVVWLPSNVVENSTACTIASGKSVSVNTAGSDTETSTYTINVTGMTANGTYTATLTGGATKIKVGDTEDTDGTISSASADNEGKATITVTLPQNGDAAKTSTITITQGDSVTTVVITQPAKAGGS